MSKPNLIDVLDLMEQKREAIAMLDEVDKQVAAIAAQHGFGRFDYDLEEFLDEVNREMGYKFDESLLDNGRYLKLELTDNVQALENGEIVWKSVAVKPVSFSTQSLKRCPTSLK